MIIVKTTSRFIPGNTPAQLASLESALSGLDGRYDETAHLLSDKVYDIRYHTRLPSGTRIHPTRESAEYAWALLESGVPWRVERAQSILRQLLALQDTDEKSATYGIWSWFFEEPLAQMSPPDWNWADFIGTQTVQILWRCEEALPNGDVEGLKAALRHAAESIIRRNVTLRYTNIAIMGTYVTIMAGEILQDAAISAYGKNRLSKFAQFTEEWGGFPEYNSPNYSIVALLELTRMLRDFPHEDDQAIVKRLHDRVWRDIALHWHAFSGQWSGPHSRAYQTILSPEIKGFLQKGLNLWPEENVASSLSEILLPIQCPAESVPYFLGTLEPRRTVRQRIADGDPVLEGVSYLEGRFALSSAERGTFWNQARAVTVYSRNAGGPAALHVQVLRDGYDYSSANILSRQKEAYCLGVICFANDGGNVHCSLDRIQNHQVEASDWRLRFQGYSVLQIAAPPREFSTQDVVNIDLSEDAVVSVRVPWLRFGDFTPRWELSSEKEALDLILYQGPPRIFSFDDAFPCGLGLALSVNDEGSLQRIRAHDRAGCLQMEWDFSDQVSLHVEGPFFPLPEEKITDFARNTKASRPS